MSAYTGLFDPWYAPAGGIDYRTLSPIRWEIGTVGSGLWITVPPGFIFQASVPLLLRGIVSPHDRKLRKASALHDYALHRLGFDRVASAALFNAGLAADGMCRPARLVLTIAVIAWRWR